jgi:CheY-like chemotaxis protein
MSSSWNPPSAPNTNTYTGLAADETPQEAFYRGALAGQTALIVEDDSRSALALTVLLERGTLNVDATTNGIAALSTLEQRSDVGIVLMDVMLPVMDGYQTMAAIRRQPRFVDLPIIAVTGKDDGEHARCLAAGASDYVRKPIDSAQLLTAIGTWLTPRQTSTTGSLQV